MSSGGRGEEPYATHEGPFDTTQEVGEDHTPSVRLAPGGFGEAIEVVSGLRPNETLTFGELTCSTAL